MRNYLVGIYLTVWNSWDIHDLSSERASGKTGVPSCYHYCKYEKKVFPCWWEPPIGLTTSRYGEAITHVVQRSLCQDCPLEVGPMQSMANREALSIVSLSRVGIHVQCSSMMNFVWVLRPSHSSVLHSNPSCLRCLSSRPWSRICSMIYYLSLLSSPFRKIIFVGLQKSIG